MHGVQELEMHGTVELGTLVLQLLGKARHTRVDSKKLGSSGTVNRTHSMCSQYMTKLNIVTTPIGTRTVCLIVGFKNIFG